MEVFLLLPREDQRFFTEAAEMELAAYVSFRDTQNGAGSVEAERRRSV